MTSTLTSAPAATQQPEHARELRAVTAVLRTPGAPLDTETRQVMETRFGHDFSAVRVHTDEQAAASARAIAARAWTFDHHIAFGAAEYRPGQPESRRLLVHELTHVVQNRRHGVRMSVPAVVGPDDAPAERIASVNANAFVAGAPIPVDSPTAYGPAVRRQSFGQVRLAEARQEEESRIGSSPIDGEFWIRPPRLPEDVVPILDDEETGVVVGFQTIGSVRSVYDLEGNLVAIEEPGAEAPLIDPIDIFAGGLGGLGGLGRSAGRGMLRGGGRAAARGAAGAALRAGVRAISRLGRAVATAIRGVYRAIRFRGPLNFTGTTAARMADAARRVPHHVLKLAIRFGTRTPDPQGVAGAFRYAIPMIRDGQQYTLEIVLREADQTVLHFLYR